MEKFGLDISVYQKGINFDILKEKVDFLIIRAGYTGTKIGTDCHKDTCFESFYKSAKERNIPVGTYWYSCANTKEKGIAEAKYMYENCLKGKQLEYPIYIDVEESKHQQVGKDLVADAIVGFCEYLEEKGYYVGIYANPNYLKNYINTNRLKDYCKWLALWTTNKNKPVFPVTGEEYGLWQYSSSEIIADMRVDTNRSYIDYPAIIKTGGYNGFSKNGNIETSPEQPPNLISNFKKDDRVILLNNATVYQHASLGVKIPETIKNKEYTVKDLTNNTLLLVEINSWVLSKECELINSTVTLYTVKAGDSLTSIAKQFNTNWKKLYDDNRNVLGGNPSLIYPGQVIKIIK